MMAVMEEWRLDHGSLKGDLQPCMFDELVASWVPRQLERCGSAFKLKEPEGCSNNRAVTRLRLPAEY